MALTITFWGTRGSIPSPGAATARYGGNTSCLTVDRDGGGQLILDAGTGIYRLGRSLVEGPPTRMDLTVLLSHTHWDHIQGLPFFRPLYHAGNTVQVLGPRQSGPSLDRIIRGQLAPEVFPVPPAALGAKMTVAELHQSEFECDGLAIATMPLRHTGPTLGYKIVDPAGGGPLTYMTDNELGGDGGGPFRAELVRFLRGTDTLVHDAMYFDREVQDRRGWGHSSAAEAASLAEEAGCRRLVLFHHDPGHDDDTLDRLRDEALQSRSATARPLEIIIAAEGSSIRC